MKTLITSGASRMAGVLAAGLAGTHDIVLTDRVPVSTSRRFVLCDLGHAEATNELARGLDAIVHCCEPGPEAGALGRLDFAMRCTYNLLWAAAEERVPRLIYLSSLRVLDTYDEGLAVTERWQPNPTTDPEILSHHLGEYVCREFARERKIDVVCLRLGETVWDADAPASSSTAALRVDDAIQAVECALNAEVPGWSVFNIQSEVPRRRYLTAAAQDALGYRPGGSG